MSVCAALPSKSNSLEKRAAARRVDTTSESRLGEDITRALAPAAQTQAPQDSIQDELVKT